MEIIWYGQSCFRILTSSNSGGKLSIVIDPFSQEIGLKLPKLEADILLITHPHSDHNNLDAVFGNYFLVSGPGEYEIKNVFIEGIFSYHDNVFGKERGENTIYVIESEDLRVCHLGDIGQGELTQEQLEKIGEIDILMIPVGGVYTISAKESVKIISQLEPKITIPMHYFLPKLKIKLDSLDKFFKALGIKSVAPIKKLTIKKKDLSPEEAKIVVLSL